MNLPAMTRRGALGRLQLPSACLLGAVAFREGSACNVVRLRALNPKHLQDGCCGSLSNMLSDYAAFLLYTTRRHGEVQFDGDLCKPGALQRKEADKRISDDEPIAYNTPFYVSPQSLSQAKA